MRFCRLQTRMLPRYGFSLLLFPLLLATTTIVTAEEVPLAVSWVSTDKHSFNPSKKEKVTLRYRLSKPATVTAQFIDPYGQVVFELKETKDKKGDYQIPWDGKDPKDNLLNPEAYTYVIHAKDPKSGEEVTYDLRDHTGGEVVYPQNVKINKTGTVSYRLQKHSRVRLIITAAPSDLPIITLFDWNPILAGKGEVKWDGWDRDKVMNPLKDGKELNAVMYAFALPQNTVIVHGENKTKRQTVSIAKVVRANISDIPHRFKTKRNVHMHATHPRERCYNPIIRASLLSNPKTSKEGIPEVTGNTTVRFDISDLQNHHNVPPLSRNSVFIFVDGELKERLLSGYEPYQWVFDADQLSPGIHTITGIFTWREDHFGIVHKKVFIDRKLPSPKMVH